MKAWNNVKEVTLNAATYARSDNELGLTRRKLFSN